MTFAKLKFQIYLINVKFIKWKQYFFLEILSESNKYGDILQEEFVDSYYNLTLKSMFTLKVVNQLMGSQHLQYYQGNNQYKTDGVRTNSEQDAYNITYLFKADDDCYVNPEAVLTYSRVIRRFPNAMVGHVLPADSPVLRPTIICDNYNSTTSNQYVIKVLFKNCKS